jgi:putative ABC transport system substrate-binding protein
MRRRRFIALFGGVAATWPLAAHAQQPTMPVVGFLGSDSPDLYGDRLRAFRQGLKETGYIERENVAIEYRWAEGRNDQLPALAADLVRLRVNVLVATTTPSVLAVKAATTTISIVFLVGGDPVALGLVASLNRPDGNLTGVTILGLEVGTKWLQLLHEIVPTATTFAVLINPTSPNLAEAQAKDLQGAALTLGLQIHLLNASTVPDLETAFATIAQLRDGGLVVTSDSWFFAHIERIAALATHYKVPTIFAYRELPAAGGLISYGADVTSPHRTVGIYAGRILNGEKPADLPVQQSSKIQLIVNLKAANALGLTVPPALLVRADEVIE